MPDKSLYNEQELLIQISQGDELAFRQIFNNYHGKLYSFILKITESNETAEDTVHDVFLKLWLHKERLPEIQHLNAYLFKMAQNTAYNGLRKLAKQTLLMNELEKGTSLASGDPDEKLATKEVMQLIHNAVSKLTPQQKEVYKMSREEGLKQEDIAKRLNISIFTVKRHLTDALNQLRKEISDSNNSNAVAVCIIFCLYIS